MSLLKGTTFVTMRDLFTAGMMRVCLEQIITPFRIVGHSKSMRRLEEFEDASDTEE